MTPTSSATASAASAAIAAYRQHTDQGSPLTGATSAQGASAALRTQVSSIISQVLTQDLGSTATGAVA